MSRQYVISHGYGPGEGSKGLAKDGCFDWYNDWQWDGSEEYYTGEKDEGNQTDHFELEVFVEDSDYISGSAMIAILARTSGLLMLVLLLGCRDGPTGPDGPDPEEWTFLGPEHEWVTDVEVTPWGLFMGTRDRGVGRLGPDGVWEWLGPEYWQRHLVPRTLLYVPGDPPRLLAGVGFWGNSEFDTTFAAVFASENQGRTWEPSDGGLAAGSPNQYRVYALDLEIDPFDSRVVYMGNHKGVLRSSDGGRTWQFVLGSYDSFGATFEDLLHHPSEPGRLSQP